MDQNSEGCSCNDAKVSPGAASCTCNVEAIVTLDERGQLIIPKELRERAGFKPGEKLALISWSRNGEICDLSLMKTEELAKHLQRSVVP